MVRNAAGLPEVEVKLRPQIRGTDFKVLGFNIGAQVARQYHAGRVFSLQATQLVSSTRRPEGSGATPESVQDAHNLALKLWQRCSTARLVPRATRYLSQ
jgi:putative polyketide hydroxylase